MNLILKLGEIRIVFLRGMIVKGEYREVFLGILLLFLRTETTSLCHAPIF